MPRVLHPGHPSVFPCFSRSSWLIQVRLRRLVLGSPTGVSLLASICGLVFPRAWVYRGQRLFIPLLGFDFTSYGPSSRNPFIPMYDVSIPGSLLTQVCARFPWRREFPCVFSCTIKHLFAEWNDFSPDSSESCTLVVGEAVFPYLVPVDQHGCPPKDPLVQVGVGVHGHVCHCFHVRYQSSGHGSNVFALDFRRSITL